MEKSKANICVILWKRHLYSVGKFEGRAFPGKHRKGNKASNHREKKEIEVTHSDVKNDDGNQEEVLKRERG